MKEWLQILTLQKPMWHTYSITFISTAWHGKLRQQPYIMAAWPFQNQWITFLLMHKVPCKTHYLRIYLLILTSPWQQCDGGGGGVSAVWHCKAEFSKATYNWEDRVSQFLEQLGLETFLKSLTVASLATLGSELAFFSHKYSGLTCWTA